MVINFHDWYLDRDKQAFTKWLESNGYNPVELNIDHLIDEGVWDNVKKFGQNAAVAGALGAGAMGMGGQQTQASENPFQVVPELPAATAQDPMQLKKAYDSYNQERPTMNDQQWKNFSGKYQGTKAGDWVPDPNKPGSWIPAGGADSVRVQGFTNVNNDQLKQDTVGTSRYQGGKPVNPTQWTGGAPRR